MSEYYCEHLCNSEDNSIKVELTKNMISEYICPDDFFLCETCLTYFKKYNRLDPRIKHYNGILQNTVENE